MPADNPWGFKLDVPALKYNRGEVANLAIGRGTLTEEERNAFDSATCRTVVLGRSGQARGYYLRFLEVAPAAMVTEREAAARHAGAR